jgi:hypothetical protein
MSRARTLLYGEPDPYPRDGSRIDTAQREAMLKRELAQLPPGGWRRGAPVEKRAPAKLPPAALDREPTAVRVVLPPPAAAAPRIPPPPSRKARHPRSGDGALIAGVTLGGAVLFALGVYFARRSKPISAPAARSDAVPPRPNEAPPKKQSR